MINDTFLAQLLADHSTLVIFSKQGLIREDLSCRCWPTHLERAVNKMLTSKLAVNNVSSADCSEKGGE